MVERSTTKHDLAVQDLLVRQNYLVVQSNDLAKAFGNLDAFPHKVLDYTFSFVTKDSKPGEEYAVHIRDILKHFGLTRSGRNYQRVADAFKVLNSKTALYLQIKREDNTFGVRMTQLFSHIDFYQDGQVRFQFSSEVAPYVFDLRDHYYSFHLSELAIIKSKYSLILMKLWESKRIGDAMTTEITGTMEEWQRWCLGPDIKWPAGRFHRDVLQLAAKELSEKLNVSVNIETQRRGRTAVGYTVRMRRNVHGQTSLELE